MTSHELKALRPASKSRVGETVTWICLTCGENPVGTTWRDSDGLHAESAWQEHFQGTPGDWSTYSVPRDFSQSVTRAREHLTTRHMLDLEQRNDESAIATESPTQGQTLPPANTSSNTAASGTMNSEQPALDDGALITHAILACANQIITAIDAAADQAFPHRRGRRDLAQVRILNAVGAMLQRLARERGLQIARAQRASQADVARALGVTRARVSQMVKGD